MWDICALVLLNPCNDFTYKIGIDSALKRNHMEKGEETLVQIFKRRERASHCFKCGIS